MSSQKRPVATDLLLGVIAGFVATAAMTVSMEFMFRQMPESERYPLPPRELTERAAELMDLRGELEEADMVQASLLSHFAFGALAGGLYGPLFLTRPSAPVATGTCFGLFIWAASYLGWIPALGLLRPATEHPGRRNALMIAAHLVWGATLGIVAHHLARALTPFYSERARGC
jgi:uncharacterized membrane protein YagU involved in acid resistance